VLRGVDLKVEAGSVVALLGANGAGKTTLMRTASGLIKTRAGKITVDGEDVQKAEPYSRLRAGLCHIPEGRGVYRGLSVRENLRLSVPPWSKNSALDQVLAQFPILGERMNQQAGSMSGGQQQMLAIARAVLAQPKVVLLDEVSHGLAPIIVDEIYASLRELAAQGMALLVVEQYVNRALDLADQVYLIRRGVVTHAGSANAVNEDALVREYMGA
jgi:branched-chain amino acid transport system ATP-binding protein